MLGERGNTLGHPDAPERLGEGGARNDDEGDSDGIIAQVSEARPERISS